MYVGCRCKSVSHTKFYSCKGNHITNILFGVTKGVSLYFFKYIPYKNYINKNYRSYITWHGPIENSLYAISTRMYVGCKYKPLFA
jgi:hypothetical protein